MSNPLHQGVPPMKQVFDQFLKFLHDGIAAIFHFVEIIWTWSVDQIAKLASVPWQQWPFWKQLLLVIVLAAVVWALFRVGRELFYAGAAILAAFAELLGVLVRTLPSVMLAGIIALTVTSEKVSFTQVIDRTPALRWADRLGRRPAASRAENAAPQAEAASEEDAEPEAGAAPQEDATPAGAVRPAEAR